MDFLRTLDPKLVVTLVTISITRVAVELLGVAADDELLQSFIALVAAAIAGWWTPNAATFLRVEQESGNPDLARPADLP